MRSKTSITVESALRRDSWSYRTATYVSYLINPLILPPLAIALVLAHLGASGYEIGMMTVLATIFFGIIPLAYVFKMVWDGETESLDVPRREDRMEPLLVGAGSYVAASVVMGIQSITATTFLVALIGIYVANTLVVVAINRFWKISVHMIGLGAFTSILLFVALHEPSALGGISRSGFALSASALVMMPALLALLMWARVRVGAHTVPQVIGGMLFGLFVPFAELYLITELMLN